MYILFLCWVLNIIKGLRIVCGRSLVDDRSIYLIVFFKVGLCLVLKCGIIFFGIFFVMFSFGIELFEYANFIYENFF